MKSLSALIPFVLLACSSTTTPTPGPCPAGQVLGYPSGCGTAASCVADTSGDAVVITFCGCDGVTHVGGGQWPPAIPWASRGACGAGDGGSDVPATDATQDRAEPIDVRGDAPDVSTDTGDAPTNCPLPPLDYSACTTDSDCAMYAAGCYCGQQPVSGVSVSNLAAVTRCEDFARMHCALGCAVMEGRAAQDGRSVTDGGTIAVRCEATDAGARSCRTYVP